MRKLVVVLLLCLAWQLHAQDKEYARWLIDTLASPAFSGRGFIDDGMGKAARFLAREMAVAGLKPMRQDYLQPLDISINTFPGPVELKVDGKMLEPGRDFLVAPQSPSIQGTYRIRTLKPKDIIQRRYKRLLADPMVFTVIPSPGEEKAIRQFSDSLRWVDPIGGKGLIRLSDRKIYWSQSGSLPHRNQVLLDVRAEAWPAKAREITLNIRAVPHWEYEVFNVFGMITGTHEPDSMILFTAHYDHLGMLGPDALFPGANDNASGTAMIMDLARFFAKYPPRWSVGFLACAAEESGLHGSEYFAAHPLVPLDQIRFVINLDMVGTGSDGIRVVNGTTHPEAFEVMAGINAADSLLPAVTAGGVSRNSDHYPFHRRGVPAFFIFTMGKEHREYHTLDDKADKLPLTKYNEVFTILRRFAESRMQP